MPANKDLKRLVRARMQKTGESYTAARSRLLSRPLSKPDHSVAAFAPAPRPTDYARLAGFSDEAVKAKTGCTWERWVWALDKVEAHAWPHRQIASYVHEKYKTPSWWTQMVTVGYERIKGLRTVGQGRDGGFEANKSRTFAVPINRLYRAFRDTRTRSRWLPDVQLTIRTAIPDRSMRITWPDGTSVQAMFLGKGTGKSQLSIQHGRFADQAAALKTKQFWGERLDALGKTLVAARR
jgi:uncharacterized protein YndB with AHSA1/START domain